MTERLSPDALAYNLCLVRRTDTDTWWVALYDAQTGSTLRFSSLAQLSAFLRIVMRNEPSEAGQTAAES